MSETTDEITEESELQAIHGIGPAREKKLGVETVGELAIRAHNICSTLSTTCRPVRSKRWLTKLAKRSG